MLQHAGKKNRRQRKQWKKSELLIIPTFLYFKPNKGAALIPEGKKQADLHLYEIHSKATSLKMSKPHHQVL